jgi:hypothetical protein
MPLATKSQQAAHPDQEVLVSTSPAGLGRITLCRERQLNALGAHHVEALRTQLLQWSDPGAGIACVLLDSNNDRSFCSGTSVSAWQHPYAPPHAGPKCTAPCNIWGPTFLPAQCCSLNSKPLLLDGKGCELPRLS